ncbi:hypothetical protein yaldo0001_5360 [Yersinia aldovae ATCC 35236]|nr:hypothetical protein yaldo0001_5360 [Yersinia aldovae ATCC 35236]
MPLFAELSDISEFNPFFELATFPIVRYPKLVVWSVSRHFLLIFM